MADFQQKENSGALFRNDRKERDDQPSHKGSALIDGTEYWMSAWVNVSKSSDRKYFGMKFEKKEQQRNTAAGSPPAPAEGFNVDEDMPF